MKLTIMGLLLLAGFTIGWVAHQPKIERLDVQKAVDAGALTIEN